MRVHGFARVRNRDYSARANDVQNPPDVRLDACQDKVDPGIPCGTVDLEQGTDACGPAEAEHVWVTVMAQGSRYVLVWKARYAAT